VAPAALITCIGSISHVIKGKGEKAPIYYLSLGLLSGSAIWTKPLAVVLAAGGLSDNAK
jgi:hypothetical protein